MNPESSVRTLIYLLIPLVLWAGNSVVGKFATALIGPFSLSFYRWLIASLILLLFAWKPLYRARSELRQHWLALTILGVLGTGLYNTLLYLGLTSTSANNAGIVMAIMPIIIISLNHLFGFERIVFPQLLGLFISLIGVAWVITQGNLALLFKLELNAGDLIVLAAVICWALYSVLLKRLRPKAIDTLSFIAIQFVIGLIFISPLYLYEQTSQVPIQWQAETVFVLLYVSVFPSLLAYYFWQQGVITGGANLAGLLYPLISIFTVIFAYIFLEERIAPAQVIGIILVVSGVTLSIICKPRNSQPEHPAS